MPSIIKLPFKDGPGHVEFSLERIKVAATLWARYLSQDTPTEEQINQFISYLSGEIILEGCNDGGMYSPHYIQIGNPDSNHLPEMIYRAMIDAGIGGDAGVLFPYKSLMRIYAGGWIHFNNNIFSPNPLKTHYVSSTTSFDNAPYMIITGKKFKLLEIPYTKGDSLLYAGEIKGVDIDIIPNPSGKVHIRVNLDDFQGTEEEFLQIDSALWCQILQSPEQIKRILKPGTFLYYFYNRKEDLFVG